jgi:DHA1 family inner membrane transport protein
MAISVLASASLFSVFTYITPLLENVTRLTPAVVTYALLVFGAGLTAGNFLGGRLADWKLMPSLLVVMTVLACVCGAFAFTSRSAPAAFVTLFVWGALAFALVPLLQMRIVTEAASAPNLASTLNQGAFNLGNATGAWLGGAALVAGVTYARLPWIGAAVAVLALGGAFISTRVREPGQSASAA